MAYVVSLNLHGRHLSEAQRGMVADRLANLKRGDNQHSPIGLCEPVTQRQAAQLIQDAPSAMAADSIPFIGDSVNLATHALTKSFA